MIIPGWSCCLSPAQLWRWGCASALSFLLLLEKLSLWQACFLPSSDLIERDNIYILLLGRPFQLQLFFPRVIESVQSCWAVGMPCVRMAMIDTGTSALNTAGQRVPISAEGRVHLQFGYYSNEAEFQNDMDKPLRDFWWVQMYFSRAISKTCKLHLLKLKDNPWVHDKAKEAMG